MFSTASHTKPARSAAAAGLGSPWKKRLSTTPTLQLNRAKRTPAHRQYTKAAAQPKPPSVYRQNLYITRAGATPKAVMSAIESNCTPNSLCVCVRRATRPSMPSKSMLSIIISAARPKFCSIACTIEMNAQKSEAVVNRLGNTKRPRERTFTTFLRPTSMMRCRTGRRRRILSTAIRFLA